MRKSKSKLITVAALVICLLASIILLPQNAYADDPTASITLIFLDDSNGGISSVVVSIQRKDGSLIGSVQAGVDGKITISGMPIGEYTVKITNHPNGYTFLNKSCNIIISNENGKAKVKYAWEGESEYTDSSNIEVKVQRQPREININIEKIVSDTGNVASGEKTFTFDLSGYTCSDKDLTVTGSSITANGAGTYSGTLKIVAQPDAFASLCESGFVVSERCDNAEDWLYDETKWLVVPSVESNTGNVKLDFYNQALGESPTGNRKTYDKITFNNSYTKDTTPKEFEINITKEVSDKGNVSSGEQTFTFELSEYDCNDTDLIVTGAKITTNGSGSYTTKLKIVAQADAFKSLCQTGFVVSEKNDNLKGWSYDETEWFVMPSIDDGTISLKIYNLAEMNNSDEFPNSYDEISFSNSYTENKAPKTGDNGFNITALSSTALVSALAIVFVLRKRNA